MPASCRGVCHLEIGAKRGGHARYPNGYAYCSVCTIWYLTEGRFCPCCGMRVRRRTHDAITRRREQWRRM